jgi:uncharacterized protein (TIGR02271 family)
MATPMFDAAFNLQRRYIDFVTKTALLPFQPINKASSMPVRTAGRNLMKTVEGTEGVIAVGEEVLEVGKQLVLGDTTRVVRTVVESPVEEEVQLMTETVVVERRRPSGSVSGDLLSDRTIEMTSTSERPIVSKARRLVEEVVLRRETTAHVETIRDSVKRDKIDIQQPNRLPAVIAPRDEREQRRDNNKHGQQSRVHG